MSRLIFIRHGESLANLERRFTRGDDEPLSPLGESQAQSTGRYLVDRFLPSALYASPYRRALHTAEILGESLGLRPSIIEGLREQSFGEMRGQPYGAFYEELLRMPPAEIWGLRPPGGESLLDVMQRVAPILDELARRHAGEEAVVVSHGGVMAAIRGHVAGLEPGPQSTDNGGGFLLEGVPEEGYSGPLPLFAD